MTTKLKELVDQAIFYKDRYASQDEFAEKLAELIVQECAEAYHQTRSIDTTIEQHFRRHLGLK
jgi:hypothetical protein